MARRRKAAGINAAAWFNAQSFHGHLPVSGEAIAAAKTSPGARCAPAVDRGYLGCCEFCAGAREAGEAECVLGHAVSEGRY